MSISLSSSSSTLSYASRSNSATGAPSGVAAGDLLLFFLYIESLTSVTVPSGASLLGYVQGSGVDFRIYVAYKIPTGSDSYAWTHSAEYTCAFTKRVTATSGFASPPVDTTNYSVQSTAWDNVITCAGINVLQNNSAVCMVAATYNQQLMDSSTLAELIDVESAGLTGDIQASSGASGNKSITYASYSTICGMLFAIYENTGGGSSPVGTIFSSKTLHSLALGRLI